MIEKDVINTGTLQFNHFSISKKRVEDHLTEKLGKDVLISNCSTLGIGWVAEGYKLEISVDNEQKDVVLRTLGSVDFSHDYVSDRLAYFVMQHHTSSKLPKHARSLDVIGVPGDGSNGNLLNSRDFVQIIEYVDGREYGEDLSEILSGREINGADIKKACDISDYLALVHSLKFDGDFEHATSLYKRHTRDMVGSVFLLDVLDTYPSKVEFASASEIENLVSSLYSFRNYLPVDTNRLKKLHGDFHPGNIIFDNLGDFTVLDSARHIWGEAADDVASMGINYIWNAIKQTGRYEGKFKVVFENFWKNYLEKSNDHDIQNIMPLFFGIRSFVLNHPNFFDVGDDVRLKMFRLSKNMLKAGEFNPADINRFLDKD